MTGCRKRKHALRIAASFFPDVESGLGIRPWKSANSRERTESQQGCHITPRACYRREVTHPPNAASALSVDTAVDRLRKHFGRPFVASPGSRR